METRRADSPSGDETAFRVAATVKNTGNETTNILDYEKELRLFDANGTDITTGFPGGGVQSEPMLEPGDTVDVYVLRNAETTAEDVARYEVTISCRDGVYCNADS